MSSESLIKYSAVIDRMKEASGLQNESAIAKALDITPQAMSNFKEKGEIPAARVIQFALKFKVSVDWLLTGEGIKRRYLIEEQPGEYKATAFPYDSSFTGTPTESEIIEIVDFLKNDPNFLSAVLKLVRAKKMEIDAWLKLRQYQIPFDEVTDKDKKEGE